MKSIDMFATLSLGPKGDAAWDLVEDQLPLLAACVNEVGNILDLKFVGNFPFRSWFVRYLAFPEFSILKPCKVIM